MMYSTMEWDQTNSSTQVLYSLYYIHKESYSLISSLQALQHWSHQTKALTEIDQSIDRCTTPAAFAYKYQQTIQSF
jgi:hypothetical protein